MSPELGPGDATQLVRDGPVIEVHVGRPRQPLRNYRALIDTGADLCYIDIAVARELDLQKIDVHRPTGVEGKRVVVPVFRATIRVGSVDVSMNDPCPAYNVRAMSSNRFDVLLGRSFLRHVSMHYRGPIGSVQLEPRNRYGRWNS